MAGSVWIRQRPPVGYVQQLRRFGLGNRDNWCRSDRLSQRQGRQICRPSGQIRPLPVAEIRQIRRHHRALALVHVPAARLTTVASAGTCATTTSLLQTHPPPMAIRLFRLLPPLLRCRAAFFPNCETQIPQCRETLFPGCETPFPGWRPRPRTVAIRYFAGVRAVGGHQSVPNDFNQLPSTVLVQKSIRCVSCAPGFRGAAARNRPRAVLIFTVRINRCLR